MADKNANWKADFTPFHIDQVWGVLATRFGFDTRQWKFRFNEYRDELKLKRADLNHDLISDFHYFGNKIINPILNEILCRREGYPTFNYLVEYVVTGKNKGIIKKPYEPFKDMR